jgi:DNA-binding transcriptional ArsR family regulator
MVTLAQRPCGRPGANAAFAAIADPTRRSILDLIRSQERSAGDIAAHFPVSRPAIARHVRLLRDAGLVRERRDATMRYYSIDAAALRSVDTWLAPYRLFWSARLMDLKQLVESGADIAGSDAVTPRTARSSKKKPRP